MLRLRKQKDLKMAIFNWKSPFSSKKTVSKVTPPQATAPVSHRAAAPLRAGPQALSQVKNVIAIASGKGGVGKSTVATNLAVALKFSGATVGLLDADIYGPSQPRMMGASNKNGKTTQDGTLLPIMQNGVSVISMGLLMNDENQNKPVVWRAPIAMKVIQQFLGNVQWGALDYLLIDLPPGTGDVQLTLAQQASLAGAVIVTTPQEVALGISAKGLEMFRQLNIPILGIIENMSGFTCKHCGEETAIFKQGGGERMAQELGVPFLGSLPLDPEIMMSGDEGVPVLDKSTTSEAAHAFLRVATEFSRQTRIANESANGMEPTKFELRTTGELTIQWPDSHMALHHPRSLRTACACASCIDENTGKAILNPTTVSPEITIRSVTPVGRYALTMEFSDGHRTGIYPFKKLRSSCECAECQAQRGATLTPAFVPAAKAPKLPKTGDLPTRIQAILDGQINPGVAGHGGKIELIEVKGSAAYLKMSGGCQGCGAAKLTLKQGVEKTLLAQLPEITEVIDVTDHSAGTSPFMR